MKSLARCSTLMLAALLLAGCGRGSGIYGPENAPTPIQVSSTLTISAEQAATFNEGDEILVAGSFCKTWQAETPEVMEHAGVVHSGVNVITYDRSIPALGESYTICYFVRSGGHLYRMINVTVAGVQLTAIVASPFQVYRSFIAFRDPNSPGGLGIDTIRDDNAKIIPVTLVFTGIAFSDAANQYLNHPANGSEWMAAKSTWNTVGDPHPMVWRNNRWEMDMWVIAGVRQMIRVELLDGSIVLPGVFIQGTELKNIYDVNQQPGAANFYPLMEFDVGPAGQITNPRPGDERWVNLSIHNPDMIGGTR